MRMINKFYQTFDRANSTCICIQGKPYFDGKRYWWCEQWRWGGWSFISI